MAIAAQPPVPLSLALADLPLPLVPRLAGAHLHVQWIVLDPSANRLGLTFSNGVDATLGAPSDLGVAWIETFDLASTTGSVLTDRTPVLRLTFER